LALAGARWALHDQLLPCGVVLVACVWWDSIAGWIARRRGWPRTSSVIQVEGFADALCFVITPALMAAAAVRCTGPAMTAIALFVLAGLWRLARFNVEGMVDRGYAGLPVTYNGYWIPLAVLMERQLPCLPDAVWYGGVLAGVSVLMVSRRFTTPEL